MRVTERHKCVEVNFWIVEDERSAAAPKLKRKTVTGEFKRSTLVTVNLGLSDAEEEPT